MENISAQTNFRISAKPKIQALDRFKAQDLKIGSFVKQGSWTALVDGVMLHGGEIKSTPSPRPKTGVRQKTLVENIKNSLAF